MTERFAEVQTEEAPISLVSFGRKEYSKLTLFIKSPKESNPIIEGTTLTPQQALLLSKKLWEWADSVEPGILLRAVENE